MSTLCPRGKSLDILLQQKCFEERRGSAFVDTAFCHFANLVGKRLPYFVHQSEIVAFYLVRIKVKRVRHFFN